MAAEVVGWERPAQLSRNIRSSGGVHVRPPWQNPYLDDLLVMDTTGFGSLHLGSAGIP